MPRRPHSLAFVLATLVVAVMLLGLPRLLVVCSGGEHGSAHVAFAHAHDACCQDDHGGADQPASDGTPGARDGTHCEHGTFAVGLAEPPRPFLAQWAPPPAAHGEGLVEPFVPDTDRTSSRVHAPATGPPRPDDWPARRRTTQLQL
ncbi:MAG: hypothetical protein JNK15_02040 [Planctomycetes bacterium]|nr:hypothetical protein [Planctomycetota bacterium]